MDLKESDEFIEKLEKEARTKKKLLISMGACAIAIILLLIMLLYYKKVDNTTLKMYLDDKQLSFSNSFMKQENEERYFNVKQICKYLGYTYNQGEYKSYTEDEEMCYVANNYKVASFGTKSEYVKKYLLNQIEEEETIADAEEENKDNESKMIVKTQGEVENKIKLADNVLYTENGIYVSATDIETIFDIAITFDGEYRVYFKTPEAIQKTNIQRLKNKGYENVSDYYENIMAVSDGMIVVGNGEKYGVVDLKNLNEIIGMKYNDIIYMQSTNEFIVTADNYQGIISADGKTILKPTLYESISPMCDMEYINDEGEEDICKLYIVEKNKKYGVINSMNEVIVSPEYNSIGIDNSTEFPEDDLTNKNLLFDLLIPVEVDGKYGLVDINGNERLGCIYDSLGYISDENNGNSDENKTEETETSNKFDNLLSIPEEVGIKGIIVKKDGLYGIYDVNLESLTIPCVFEKIYSKTKISTKTYYFQYNGEECELSQYLEENNLKSVE